jgi:hypothetical protein
MPHSKTAKRPTGPAPTMATSVVRGLSAKQLLPWSAVVDRFAVRAVREAGEGP